MMTTFGAGTYSDAELEAEFDRLFPQGFAGADVLVINLGRQMAELSENKVVVADHFLTGKKVEPFRPST